VPSARRNRSSAARVLGSIFLAGGAARGVPSAANERLGVANREAEPNDVARDPPLRGFVGERQDGAGVAHVERTARELLADLDGQPKAGAGSSRPSRGPCQPRSQ